MMFPGKSSAKSRLINSILGLAAFLILSFTGNQSAFAHASLPDACSSQAPSKKASMISALRKQHGTEHFAALTLDKISLGSNKKDGLLLVSPGSRGKLSSPQELILTQGKILLFSRTPLKISTELADIYVTDNAIVLLQLEKDSLAVTNMCDFHRNSVRIIADNTLINTEIGERILLTKELPAVDEVFNNASLGLRRLRSQQLNSGNWVTSAELSLLDALKHDDMLRCLRTMPLQKPEAALLKPIVKAAAATTLVFRNREGFFHLNRDSNSQILASAGN